MTVLSIQTDNFSSADLVKDDNHSEKLAYKHRQGHNHTFQPGRQALLRQRKSAQYGQPIDQIKKGALKEKSSSPIKSVPH